MNYVLVENKQTVLLGPTPWRPRAFQSELSDLDVDVQISSIEPQGHLNVNENFDIFPVDSIIVPDIDLIYEELVGPFWTFGEHVAKAEYSKKDRNIDYIKSDLKQKLATERYRKENLGFQYTVLNTDVTLDTSREIRQSLINAYNLMDANSTIQWKFKETWLTLSKSDVEVIVKEILNYVQNQFNWEKTITDSIDACQSIEELKLISIAEENRL